MDFSDIIGQREMAARLKALADEGRLPHALMLCGPDGAGKMALAIALATYILNGNGLREAPEHQLERKNVNGNGNYY